MPRLITVSAELLKLQEKLNNEANRNINKARELEDAVTILTSFVADARNEIVKRVLYTQIDKLFQKSFNLGRDASKLHSVAKEIKSIAIGQETKRRISVDTMEEFFHENDAISPLEALSDAEDSRF